jgi:two-component system nitrogen regulation response regulator NtrX
VRRILIIDDEKNIRTQLSGLLADEGYGTFTAESAERGLALLAEESPDLVLLDVWMPGMDGLAALEKLRAEGRDVPVLVMSGQATIDTAVRATRLGAFDYLEKPLDPARLLVTIRNALQSGELQRRNRELVARVGAGQGLLGSSAVMQRLRDEVERAARSDARVLITGENGTGKELVARALHEGSPRADGPFGRVNCAAIPRDLIESELFGHEKGAFTGAESRKIGKIEAADGGSLLLDEVGDMALEAQAKLLRVFEENEVERVGGGRPIRVDVRVIAATNKDLSAAIEKGEFREDLYYRLNVVPIAVPPLRDRAEDIPELVDHFHRRFAEEMGRPLPPVDEGAYGALKAWPWPGNVRELRNVVERLAIMTEGESIGRDEVGAVLAGSRPGAAPTQEGSETTENLPLRDLLENTERAAILRALKAAGGTVSEAARRLGLDRANLHRKMRRLGIGKPEGETASSAGNATGEAP